MQFTNIFLLVAFGASALAAPVAAPQPGSVQLERREPMKKIIDAAKKTGTHLGAGAGGAVAHQLYSDHREDTKASSHSHTHSQSESTKNVVAQKGSHVTTDTVDGSHSKSKSEKNE